MVEVTKLVNVMLIFFTLFVVVVLSIDSKPFSSLFKFPSLLYYILFYLN